MLPYGVTEDDNDGGGLLLGCLQSPRELLCSHVSNRRSRRWMNDRLLIELVPRLHVEEIKGLFAPPPWGEELPLSAFCRTSVGEWDAFRSIDMDAEARLMQHMKISSEKLRTHVDEDESIALMLGAERVRAFIEDTSDKDVLVLNVQDPFQRLLLHGVCEFYNVTSTTTSSVRDGKPWKTTTIKKRPGTERKPTKLLVANQFRYTGTQASLSSFCLRVSPLATAGSAADSQCPAAAWAARGRCDIVGRRHYAGRLEPLEDALLMEGVGALHRPELVELP
ncbi:R3H domain-containing protein 4-like [Panicum miliaceum]|uniref:R3H domain-containing protein 4-like n=1 Tax=Panicum miliaceum TaxID=4540 RepID=A0A3L6RC47_PANMI|nr:R3H domain-containing protein 4-like [Panicum miliaceum]